CYDLSTALATTVIYTLSLHDALPIFVNRTFDKAQALARELAVYFSGPRVLGPEARLEAMRWEDPRLRTQLGRTDLVINATTLGRSEEHTSELQSRSDLVCRLLLEKKK